MIELALGRLGDRANVDVGFVFFGREELPFADSALSRLLEREPGLRTADAVIVMEPTGNAIHAGCLGNINARLDLLGRQRPLGAPVVRRQRDPPRRGRHRRAGARSPTSRASSTGCASPQVVSVTRVAGGIADNVIPDTATAHVNFRYAPGTSAEEAEALLRSWCEPYGTIEITGNAPSAPVATQQRPRAAAASRRATSRSSPSRPGRRSRSSPPPASTRSTSAPATRSTRTGATSRSRSTRSSAATRPWSASHAAEPGPRPVSAPTRSCASTRRRRRRPRAARGSSTSARASRARRRRRSSAAPWPRRSRPSPSPATRRPRACRSCARRSPTGSRAGSARDLDPATEIVPTLGSQGGDLRARPGRRRPGRAASR